MIKKSFKIIGILLIIMASYVLITYLNKPKLSKEEIKESVISIKENIKDNIKDNNIENTIKLDNNYFLGILTIDSINLQIPILSELNLDNLDKYPSVYNGSLNNNLIIAGHNYKDYFGNLHKININDQIEIESANGLVYKYAVVKKEILNDNDIEKMKNSNYDLTIFTCTADGNKRYTVRCNLL